jgi:ring-1,2-phenylacetyl-CoA epoxidase subunit PaaC
MVRSCADAGRGHGARQYGPRPDRAGARTLHYAAKVEDAGNDEDKLAYLRDVRQYRNLLLVEQPNGDFARTIVRQFFYSAFADPYWRAMMRSKDATLAAIAAKSEKKAPIICATPRNG